MTEQRVVMIGLDGATFTLLDPWMAEGRLPRFRQLNDEGVRGALQSTFPPHSGAAWASFMTGMNPGKHGVFGFHHPPDPEGGRAPVSLPSIAGAKFWDLMGERGKRVGLLNVPMTYPPQPVNGFMVSGLMTPDPSAEYTWPPDLKGRVASLVGEYLIEPETERFDPQRPEELPAFLHHIAAVTEARLALARNLMAQEAWDCFVVVFVFPDRIQHRCWEYLHPRGKHYGSQLGQEVQERTCEIFYRVDRFLGEVLSGIGDPDCFVISDHGFGFLEGYLNVNRVLLETGHLFLKPGASRGTRSREPTAGKRLLKALTPAPLRRLLRRQFGLKTSRLWQVSMVETQIDWERTRAYFPGFPEQGIYINRFRVPVEECEGIRRAIREALLALRHPGTGQPLVDRVFFREEIYSGPKTAVAPDLFFIARDFTVWGRPRLDVEESFSPERGARGYHQPDGILLARGPRLRRNTRVEGAHLMNLAPTLLHLLGVPVPTDMDGRVQIELLAPEFLEANPVRFREVSQEPGASAITPVYTAEDAEAINARLQALGYIE